MVSAGQISALVLLGTAAGAVLSIALAVYAYREFDHPTADPFAAVMVADALWALASLGVLLVDADLLLRALDASRTLFSALAAVAWVHFVTVYTGDRAWLPDWTFPLLLAEAVVYWILWVVNPGRIVVDSFEIDTYGGLTLISQDLGIGAGLQILLVYSLLLATVVLLGRFLFSSRNVYRIQTVLIMLFVTSVAAAALAWAAGVTPHPGLDLTPLMFITQAGLVWIALTRFGFLKVVPTAADTLLEEMGDPVFVVDASGTVMDMNQAASRLVDQRTGTADNLGGLLPAPLYEAIKAAEQGEAGQGTVEDPATGERIVLDIERTPVTDHFGTTHGFLIVCRDVTERVHHQRQLEAQNEHLEAFARVVSHDLRDPLSVAEGHAEILDGLLDEADLGSAGDDEARASLAKIRRSHRRMGEIVEDVLTIAREGKTVAEVEPVSLEAVATEAWGTVGTDRASLSVPADGTVEADRSRLLTVLENLFRNAIDHGPADVTVTVEPVADGFAVADDGPGIEPDQRERIFEDGYTTEPDNTGLGLSIVRTMAESHGWTVDLEDAESGGARFVFRRPGDPAVEPVDDTSSDAQPE